MQSIRHFSIRHSLRHITWRGALRSCNYSCDYCPLAKQEPSAQELLRDRAALEGFIASVEQLCPIEPLSILFAPYGEALIHRHTQEALARLSRLKQVAWVSCQTNLSIPAQDLLQHLHQEGAVLSKIALWASFHPTMCSTAVFLRQVQILHDHLAITAVVVADPRHRGEILPLHRALPMAVRLSVNAMDGLGRRYSTEEKGFYQGLDPLFALETARHPADFRFCGGGCQSVFVRSDGSATPCIRSKFVLGNFYQGTLQLPPEEGPCQGRCDCFLAYSNRHDLTPLHSLGTYPQLRL